MTDHGDQLREAFEAHENTGADPAAVYARVLDLSKTYKRRRLGVQVVGGVALSAGLIGGIAVVPNLLPAGKNTGTDAAIVAPAAAPTPSATKPTEAQLQGYWDAYFNAGYDYDDALKLAQLWQSKDNIGLVKAEAGRRLLGGETLPFAATPNPPETEEPVDPKIQAQVSAYFYAGYDWDNAVKLAKIWKLSDPYDAKVKGGKLLLAGKTLPVKPSPANVKAGLESRRVNAFFEAGYDVYDAAKLAKIWKKSDAYQAKVEGGKRLLAGQTLPIKP